MRSIPRLLISLLALALGSSAVGASAQPPPTPSAEPPAVEGSPPLPSMPVQPAPVPIPLNRIYLASLTLVRYNPLGLETQNRLVFQHRLQDSFSFTTRECSSFNKPTLLAMASWYLDHRSREGALPYLLLGFSWSSDFLAPGGSQGAAPQAASWKVPRSLTSQ